VSRLLHFICNTLSSKINPLGAFSLCVLLFVLSACATQNVADRIESSKRIATNAGFESIIINAPQFSLQAFIQPQIKVDILSIYIEGDGHAWRNSQTPSDDPTPINPIALKLALKDPRLGVAYLGRPCQYVGAQYSKNCDEMVWTDRRFSPEVVAASNFAIDQLKDRYHAKKVKLIGYSGGGAIALLVAANRTDVDRVITVAGNIDTRAWVSHHRLRPLLGSLNPADFAKQLVTIPQIHYVGGRDEVVPALVAKSYVAKFPQNQRPAIHMINDYAHVCCWVEGRLDINADH
jgi:pimeloyl-ACP methyl ester carboxylesterase